ncbi:MAG TPA: SRPBCC family protein [Polyangia bacterium]|nr:SRPBCC family protein [Polyangia bacterium]
MPEVEYMTTMKLPPEQVWEFVRDMNNWAPFLTGYQRHEIENETDSIWTLKGDVGVLSRTVRLKAHVTEWNGPERVAFTLVGIDEVVEGGGMLTIAKPSPADAPIAAPPKRGLWRRMVDGFFRWLFRRMNGPGVKRLEPARAEAASQLTFKLRMDAGGPSGPLVNAMLAPALMPAAEDLANKIAAHLEQLHGVAAR